MTESSGSAVECYSSYTYAQEPRALVWEGQRHLVSKVEARWRAPGGAGFRVRTESGKRFNLYYHEAKDGWTIVHLPDCPS
jgi:hypothetical protein